MAIANITGNILTDSGVATSSLLPLSGGTLTGALSGTSATFSGNGLFGGSTNAGNAGTFTLSVGVPGTTAGGLQLWAATNQSSFLQFGDSTTAADNYRGYVGYNHATDTLSLGTASADKLTIASTGAATFSSSVTAGNGTFVGDTETLRLYTPINTGYTSLKIMNDLVSTSRMFDIRYYGSGSSVGESAWLGTIGGAPISFSTTNTERLRITAAGNVGIGTSSPGAILHTLKSGTAIAGIGDEVFIGQRSNSTDNAAVTIVSNNQAILRFTNTSSSELGAVGYSTVNNFMEFKTNSSPRMVIRSDGNVGIGNTGESASRFYVTGQNSTSSNYAVMVRNTNGNELFIVRNDGLIYTGLTTLSPVNNTTGAAANVWINTSDGTLGRSTSSIKYKKNVQDYTKGLAEVMQLRPVTYNGKSQIDEGKTFAGLIAEEVHELGLTEFVQYAEDGTPDAIAYTHMIALLTKAIQELKAEIEELKNK